MAIYKYHNTYMYMTIMIHLMILSHLSVHIEMYIFVLVSCWFMAISINYWYRWYTL